MDHAVANLANLFFGQKNVATRLVYWVATFFSAGLYHSVADYLKNQIEKSHDNQQTDDKNSENNPENDFHNVSYLSNLPRKKNFSYHSSSTFLTFHPRRIFHSFAIAKKNINLIL